MVLPDDTVEITFFNRGNTLFISDDERVRRIHRVLCRLDIGVAEIRSDGGGTE